MPALFGFTGHVLPMQGSAINKSLLTLGNVVRALGEGKVRSGSCYA